MWSRLMLSVFLVATLISTSLQAQEDAESPTSGKSKVVRAVGKAQAGGVAAEDEALRDALRKAVEQAAGQFISSVSQTQDYELIRDEIFSEVKGFVETYKILRKWTQGDILCLEIEAKVALDAFRAGWEKLQALINQWGKRRFACIVNDKIDNKPDQGHATETAIEKVFLDRGFPMVNKAQLEQIRERIVAAATIEGNLQEVANLSKRYGVEVLLVGDANAGEAERQTIYGTVMYFYQPSVEIKAIRVDNAMLIASENASVRKGNTNKFAAAKDALRESGTKVAKQIVNQVIKAMLKDTTGQGNLIQITVLEIGGRRNAVALVKALKAIRNVNKVYEREFSEGMLTVDVETTIPASEMADRMLEFTEPKVDITEITPNHIKAKVIK